MQDGKVDEAISLAEETLETTSNAERKSQLKMMLEMIRKLQKPESPSTAFFQNRIESSAGKPRRLSELAAWLSTSRRQRSEVAKISETLIKTAKQELENAEPSEKPQLRTVLARHMQWMEIWTLQSSTKKNASGYVTKDRLRDKNSVLNNYEITNRRSKRQRIRRLGLPSEIGTQQRVNCVKQRIDNLLFVISSANGRLRSLKNCAYPIFFNAYKSIDEY